MREKYDRPDKLEEDWSSNFHLQPLEFVGVNLATTKQEGCCESSVTEVKK